MQKSSDGKPGPVNAKAVLIDPASMTALWMNESAARDVGGDGAELDLPVALPKAVPLTEVLGLTGAVNAVADTGLPVHLRTGLVSTSRGSVVIAASLYPLPDGSQLLIIENDWEPGRAEREGTISGTRSVRRRR